MMNPKPMEKFLDFIVIGDGEDVMVEIAKRMVANSDKTKMEKLQLIEDLDGVYIPALHKGKKRIRRAIVEDLEKTEFYDDQLVPYINIVHDLSLIHI